MNLKNSSYLPTNVFLLKRKLLLQLSFLFIFANIQSQSVANYINNGSFELKYSCTPPFVTTMAKNWMSIDSNVSVSGAYFTTCNSSIPYPNGGFQYPRTGNALIGGTWYCDPTFCNNLSRAYPKNRLKANLIGGKTYCVKFYVNITNQSPYGMDGFGAYFGDNSIDTITKCTIPLTYITPQVQNPSGNIILDTLNWTLITGTFTANGTEKYCLLGNFKSHITTNSATLNPLYLPQQWTDVLLDDVSCIPIDLPAYAGADIYAPPSTTVYIGRPQDVGIDEACTWYNLTNTTTPIANAAGITLTVTTTQSYMVKQNICGIIKYDTVIVYASGVGLNSTVPEALEGGVTIYPNPANEMLNVKWNPSTGSGQGMGNVNTPIYNFKFIIYNFLGQMIREEEITFTNYQSAINIKDFKSGVYFLKLYDKSKLITTTKFIKQ